MDLNDIKSTQKLIDECSKKQRGELSGIFLDDDIILNDSLLTKACILFDTISVNHINPNIYIRTIYNNFDFEKVQDMFKQNDKIKFEKCFCGSVGQYNFINFININKSLVEEGILIPNVFHKLPVVSSKPDEKVLLNLLKGNENRILNLVMNLNLKHDKSSFCIDEPIYYLLKLICINESFLQAVSNNKILVSEKLSIAKYAALNAKTIERITVYDTFDSAICNFDIRNKDIETAMNNIILDSFNVLVPNFPILEADDILEVRYKLKDELTAYRFLIKDIIAKYANNKEISNEEIIYKEITQKIQDINLKLKSEKGKLFRSIVQYATAIPGAVDLLTGGDIKSIVVSSFGSLVKIACELNKYLDNKNAILRSSENLPYIFLVKAQKIK